jgi:hypothetical protein
MDDNTIFIPEEDRTLVVAGEERVIVVPPEWRKIRVLETMLVASKQHTEGDVRRWTVQYGSWLDNAAQIETIDVQSDSDTCTVNGTEVLGQDIVFSLSGGTLGERVTIKLTMTDDQGNTKNDTVKFTVVAP